MPVGNMRALLHVEDDDAMATVIRAAVDEAAIDVNLFRVSGGAQALGYLRGEAPYVGSARPDLVFLDLHMAGMDGWQVLAEIRADESLRSIPVVVLSTSRLEADRDRAYTLGARRFVTKPASFRLLIAEVESAYRALAAESA